MNKKIRLTIIIALVLFCSVFFLIFLLYKNNVFSSDINEFTDYVIDVADAPDYVVKIGSENVQFVSIDEEELSEDDYLIKNGYFAFAYDNFAQLGIGTHEIEIHFEKSVKRFSITVSDNKPAEYVLSSEIADEIQIGEATLPKILRSNTYQSYSVSYKLEKDGSEVYMNDKVDCFEVDFKTCGKYKYTVSITKNGKTYDNRTEFNVIDKFDYSIGKDYATSKCLEFWTSSPNVEWDTNQSGIKANNYVGISNSLIQRAKQSGQKYLEVTFGASYDNPSYIGFNYLASNEKSLPKMEGEMYSTGYKQSVIIDLRDIVTDVGVTELFYATANLPMWIYSAKFVDDPLDDNINYGQHVYKNAIIWNSTAGSRWDYAPGDIMQLWTTGTMKFKTDTIKQAIELGYSYVIFEATNTYNTASLYYNEVLPVNDISNELNASSATEKKSFENGSVSVTIDIRNISNAISEWTNIAGITEGKIVVKNLKFTKEPISSLTVKNKEESIKSISINYGDTIDLSKISLWSSVKESNVVWTVEGKEMNMLETAALFSEGSYEFRAELIEGNRRGSTYFTLNVIRQLVKEDIEGELIGKSKKNLWRNEGVVPTVEDGRLTCNSTLSLSAMAISVAKANGMNYLELTGVASNGWLGIDLFPGKQSTKTASASTFDGVSTVIIDISAVTASAGFIKICSVNAYSMIITHAQFIKNPVSEKVDYAHLYYGGDSAGYLTSTKSPDGKSALKSVSDLKSDLAPYFDVDKQLWKAMYVTKNGAIGISKKIVQNAINSGYGKIRVNLIGIQNAKSVYYGIYGLEDLNGVLLPSDAEVISFVNGRATIEIDITNIEDISGDWVYFVGNNDDGIVLAENIFFTNN